MKRSLYTYIDRNDFVWARYERFREKKKRIEELGIKDHVWITDLDAFDSQIGKTLKEVVICDSCNEDIVDSVFVMYEKRFVYHNSCAAGFLPGFDRQEVIKAIVEPYENVISIFENHGEE